MQKRSPNNYKSHLFEFYITFYQQPILRDAVLNMSIARLERKNNSRNTTTTQPFLRLLDNKLPFVHNTPTLETSNIYAINSMDWSCCSGM